MKPIKEVLKELMQLSVELDKADQFTELMIINDMELLLKNKITDEVKKHLEIASNKALIYHHSRDYKVGVKSKIVRQKIMISEVHKESITDIEINLT